jgi:methionine-gamma-lyase
VLRKLRRNAELGFSTRAIHVGYDPLDPQGEQGAEVFAGTRDGYIYGRTKNPTQTILEERIASLEGAEAALAVGSGMGAISALAWTLLAAGSHVVIDRVLYGNTFALFTRGLTRFGVNVSIADFTRPETVADAIGRDTRLVFFETPANPNLRVIDIEAIAALARDVDVLTVVDSTFATPALQRPIEYGADIVVHSATKYLGGHGDLIAGVIAGPADIIKEIRLKGLRAISES